MTDDPEKRETHAQETTGFVAPGKRQAHTHLHSVALLNQPKIPLPSRLKIVM
jgi:hypothetical protein